MFDTEFRVRWEDLDQQSKLKERSRGRACTLSIGTSGEKVVESPSRGIKVNPSNSDFSLWNKVTNGLLYPKGLAFMHMRVQHETLRNIADSNGEFNRKVSSTSSLLQNVDEKAIRAVYPRIPATESGNVRVTERNITAFLDFLNKATGNDANMLPLPPTVTLMNRLDEVKKGINRVYTTDSKSKFKPLFGYVPAFDNPRHAERVVNMYLGLDVPVKAFVIDFGNGKKDSTANVVIRRLEEARKKEGLGDYYVHAVDVPKEHSRTEATAFYDLPLVIEGIDSFHNNLIIGGPSEPESGQSVVEFNKGKKFPLQSQYGSFTFKELDRRHLLGELCDCPVCRERGLDELFKISDHKLFQDTVAAHRIHVNLQETEEQRRVMSERGSLLDYLVQKPMAKSQVASIMTMIRGID